MPRCPSHLCQICRCCPQNLIGLTQFAVLTRKFLDPRLLGSRRIRPLAAIALDLPGPHAKADWRTARFTRDRRLQPQPRSDNQSGVPSPTAPRVRGTQENTASMSSSIPKRAILREFCPPVKPGWFRIMWRSSMPRVPIGVLQGERTFPELATLRKSICSEPTPRDDGDPSIEEGTAERRFGRFLSRQQGGHHRRDRRRRGPLPACQDRGAARRQRIVITNAQTLDQEVRRGMIERTYPYQPAGLLIDRYNWVWCAVIASFPLSTGFQFAVATALLQNSGCQGFTS